MPDSSAAPVVAPFPTAPMSNGCAQVDAMDRQTAAIEALTRQLETATAVLTPAADAVVGFEARLDKLCKWLRRWGPWALASMPAVLTAVGAISPNAAAALKAALTVGGAQ